MVKLKVLVVDDNEDVRELVSVWLKGLHEVDSAVDGSDCLAKIKKVKYDLILLDVMMPGPKPAALINEIGKVLPEVMIIYLTAVEMFNPTPEQEKKGFLPTITDLVKGYLIKPITREQLVSKIDEVLNMQSIFSKTLKKASSKPR